MPGFAYQYLRTLEALMDAIEKSDRGVVAVHVVGLPGVSRPGAVGASAPLGTAPLCARESVVSTDDVVGTDDRELERLLALPEDRLLDLLGDAQSVHRQWRHQLRGGHAALQAEFDALVRGAKRIRNFEIAFIPGLLQTEDYTRYRALETVRLHGAAAEGVDAAIAARRARQDVLYEEGKTFEFVITEAAFRLLPCPRPVMLAQLDRLMTASTLANVTLGIIPFDVELNVMPMVGFLSVDNLTVAETFTSEDAVGPTESKKYREIFALLMAEAATGDEARRRIAAAATGLREESGGAVEQH